MKNFHPTGNCPVRDVLSRLGDKWSMLVLITLNANGTMRFSDIHKTIGDVSQRMLTVLFVHSNPMDWWSGKCMRKYLLV